MRLILVYLVAIVLANLSVAYFGPSSTIINAFLLIGLDFTTRDALHEQWKRKNLWRNMLLLILAGSVVTYLLNRNAGMVAIASITAFALSSATDTWVYHLLSKKKQSIRINGSNTVSAAVDSMLFPTIAFGVVIPFVVIGQFLAKVLGGYMWSLFLNKNK